METLEQFPAKIEDVYEQTWKRISNQDPEHASVAKAALLWVLYAKDSLTIEALCRAIAICPKTHRFEEARLVPSSTIIDLCHGLVTLDEKSSLVRLVRKSSLRRFYVYLSSLTI
jgi:ankyrin repeat domain-containing protein 50